MHFYACFILMLYKITYYPPAPLPYFKFYFDPILNKSVYLAFKKTIKC